MQIWREAIPGRRASNRESTSLPDRSSCIRDKKLALHRRAKRTASLDILGGATKLPEIGRGQTQDTAPDQRQDPVGNSLRKRKPVQNIMHVARDMVELTKMANKARCQPQNPLQASDPPHW